MASDPRLREPRPPSFSRYCSPDDGYRLRRSGSRGWDARSSPHRRLAASRYAHHYDGAEMRAECQRRSGDAAVDIKRVSIHKGGSIAGKKDGRADQFLDIAPTGGGRALFKPGREFLAVDKRLIERRLEIAGRYGVDRRRPCLAQSAHMPRVGFFTAPFVAV